MIANSLSVYTTEEAWNEAQKDVFEADKNERYLGSRWGPFGGSEEILIKLPEFLEKSVIAQSFSDVTSVMPPFKSSMIAQAGACLSHPNHLGYIMLVIAICDDKNMLVSTYPYRAMGCTYEVEIDTVHVWESGLEAQISVSIGDFSLSFFDTHFALNRDFYGKGGKYRFRLLGIAYSAGYPKETEITVKMKKEVLRAMGEEVDADTDKTFSLVGMKQFISIVEWDRDDFAFRGVITLVKTTDMFEQKVYYVEIDALKSLDGEVFDIPMIITKEAWKENSAPKVGDEIGGELWLQGSLMGVV